MTMPLHQMARNTRIVDEGANQLVHAARQRGARIGYSVSQGIAEPHLDVDAAFLPQFHQFNGKGDAEAVNICPRDILKVTARSDAYVQDGFDDAKVLIKGLFSGFVKLKKDVIIGSGGQDARFRLSHLS